MRWRNSSGAGACQLRGGGQSSPTAIAYPEARGSPQRLLLGKRSARSGALLPATSCVLSRLAAALSDAAWCCTGPTRTTAAIGKPRRSAARRRPGAAPAGSPGSPASGAAATAKGSAAPAGGTKGPASRAAATARAGHRWKRSWQRIAHAPAYNDLGMLSLRATFRSRRRLALPCVDECSSHGPIAENAGRYHESRLARSIEANMSSCIVAAFVA